MYNNQEIAFKIKQSAKSKKVTVKQLLEKCNLNINYISQFANGKDMTAGNLYKIADLLDVSVDYLLGRSDAPASSAISDKQATEFSAEDAEILALIKKLPLKKRVKFISSLYDELDEP
ncbi:MAG: helix-turn-helix domain-containing protein [Ruminococcus sp.]|nr:helix-turn-helix domain-containing protein [Ruminococcus sp.]